MEQKRKTKHQFLTIAVMKTTFSGLFYLLMPILASKYHEIIGKDADRYIGYLIASGFLFVLMNLILLFRAWALVFDSDTRERYYKND
jgi:sensor histidine kinase YesM